jgi:hypothetical protein
LQHLAECPECSTDLDRFDARLSMFRNAIRDRINDQIALHPAGVTPPSTRPAETGITRGRWALSVAAGVLLLMFSSFLSENRPPRGGEQVSTDISPEEIMNAMNRHLSRVVPAPMEPMMTLIPAANEEVITVSGGNQ